MHYSLDFSEHLYDHHFELSDGSITYLHQFYHWGGSGEIKHGKLPHVHSGSHRTTNYVTHQTQVSNQKPDPWAAIGKARQFPSREKRGALIFACSLCAEAGEEGVGAESTHMSVKKSPFVFYGEWGLVDAELFSLSDTDDLGAIPSNDSHKTQGGQAPLREKLEPCFYHWSQGREGKGRTYKPFQASETAVSFQMQTDQKFNPWAAARKVCSQTPSKGEIGILVLWPIPSVLIPVFQPCKYISV